MHLSAHAESSSILERRNSENFDHLDLGAKTIGPFSNFGGFEYGDADIQPRIHFRTPMHAP